MTSPPDAYHDRRIHPTHHARMRHAQHVRLHQRRQQPHQRHLHRPRACDDARCGAQRGAQLHHEAPRRRLHAGPQGRGASQVDDEQLEVVHEQLPDLRGGLVSQRLRDAVDALHEKRGLREEARDDAFCVRGEEKRDGGWGVRGGRGGRAACAAGRRRERGDGASGGRCSSLCRAC